MVSDRYEDSLSISERAPCVPGIATTHRASEVTKTDIARRDRATVHLVGRACQQVRPDQGCRVFGL
jgi:hypothetical protein